MRKSGFARTSSCFLAVGLWLATSVGFRPAVDSGGTVPVASSTATPEYEFALDQQPTEKSAVEVIDLTVKSLEEQPQNVRVVNTQLTDGFRPGSVDPANAAAAAIARTQQWSLAEVYVENSEVTESGYVEYTLRASLRGDSARATASQVIAAARAVSPEVSVVAESLHFTTKPGDELDSLSSDAIRVRVKGGLTFEPSMLRWSFIATALATATETTPAAAEAASEASELSPLAGPERLP